MDHFFEEMCITSAEYYNSLSFEVEGDYNIEIFFDFEEMVIFLRSRRKENQFSKYFEDFEEKGEY